MDPIAGGFHIHGDVMTPAFNVTIGTPFAVELELDLLTSGRPYETTTFQFGLTFPPAGPVLELPGRGATWNRGSRQPIRYQGPPTAAFSVTPVNSDCGTAILPI